MKGPLVILILTIDNWLMNSFLQVSTCAAKEDDYTLSCDAKSSCAFHMIGFSFPFVALPSLYIIFGQYKIYYLFSLLEVETVMTSR